MAEKLKDPEWKPDFGPDALNEQAGVTAVGAREFLIAYNVNLNVPDRRYANEIAYALRERGRWKRTGEIAKELNLSVKTTEYYREQIKRKLNLASAAELTQHATTWAQSELSA